MTITVYNIIGDIMKEKSFYRKNIKELICPQVSKNIHCDVVIVGGGLTGILSAYYLKDSGLKVAVVEKDTYISKTSANTTGKVTWLQGLMYQNLVKHYGFDVAKQYYKSNFEALEEIKRIIDFERIRCDVKVVKHYIYTNDESNVSNIEEEYNILKQMNLDVELDDLTEIDFKKSISVKGQLVFNPVLYGQALIEICKKSGVAFYDHSLVTNIKEVDLHQQIICNGYKINSAYTIVATRYPIPVGNHNFLLQLQQSISYLSYVDVKHNFKDSYYCIDDSIESFRILSSGYFYGGYSHFVGEDFDIKDNLYNSCFKKFGKNPKCWWSTQDGMSNRLLPYIGYYYNKNNPCLVACGYNKWGMTLSHVAAKIMRDLILFKDSTYRTLYDPLKNRYKILYNNGITMTNHLFKGYILKRITYSSVSSKANVVSLHKPIRPICSHAGGILCYNANSKTWDCINHGARFNLDGKALEMPAINDLKKKD